MARDDHQSEPFDLDGARRKLRRGGVVAVPDVELTFCTVHGRPVRFATDMPRDPIQRRHRKGVFYEADELAALRHHMAPGATFVDIGANVGNHSLYAALFLAAGTVVPFEPNPRAYRLLMTNVMLNGLQDIVSFAHLGLGLSDAPAAGFGMSAAPRNLGGAQMMAGEGDIEVTTGDIALKTVTPDFIKIDVEGMEMGVLAGLRDTIARAKPKLLVEVNETHYDAFQDWVAASNYHVVSTFQRYADNKNFLIEPEVA